MINWLNHPAEKKRQFIFFLSNMGHAALNWIEVLHQVWVIPCYLRSSSCQILRPYRHFLFLSFFFLCFPSKIINSILIIMGNEALMSAAALMLFGWLCSLHGLVALSIDATQDAHMKVNVSSQSSRTIPENMFGIFFEVCYKNLLWPFSSSLMI